jgi:hypothetical protein
VLADLDETIRQILIAGLPVKNGEIEISFDQPRREWSARLNRPTVNLYMYDLRENTVLRQHQWERLPGNGSAGDQQAQKRTPLRVDCTYALTTWAAEAEDEHRLLTRCMLALFRYPVLPQEFLAGGLLNQPFDIQARLATNDKLTNPAELWSALDNELRPTIPYTLTLALDPWTEVSGPIVRTFTLRYGQAAGLPYRQQLGPGQSSFEMSFIGGMVRSKTGNKSPMSGVEVAIKGTGLITKTGSDGRFMLGGLPPGQYTLVAWAAQGKPGEKPIHVPAEDGGYDIEL